MNVLVTGGCGFIGSHLCIALQRQGYQVWAADSFQRSGSELNVERLRGEGVQVLRADVRRPRDFQDLPRMNAVVLAAAEPAVSAGLRGDPNRVLSVNLSGCLVCLELARQWHADVILLSTSRVYSIRELTNLPHRALSTRFQWEATHRSGFSADLGISEAFPTTAPRSMYGASKLATETVLSEYAQWYGQRVVINRFGLVAGPWQMARADQGVVALWVAKHLFRQPLTYFGFGGAGHQVRDVLHVQDACDLMLTQMQDMDTWNGQVVNVGGGVENSVSLLELTGLCQNLTGNRVPVGGQPSSSSVDIPIYISDNSLLYSLSNWRPSRSVDQVVAGIRDWVASGDEAVHRVLQS